MSTRLNKSHFSTLFYPESPLIARLPCPLYRLHSACSTTLPCHFLSLFVSLLFALSVFPPHYQHEEHHCSITLALPSSSLHCLMHDCTAVLILVSFFPSLHSHIVSASRNVIILYVLSCATVLVLLHVSYTSLFVSCEPRASRYRTRF